HGSAGHGADHVLPLLVSPSISVPVLDGRLGLGTWQSIALLDPNPDNDLRTVRLSFLPG
ncbi:MAG: YjbQ family protein, partial [Chloroflexi bacterium]